MATAIVEVQRVHSPQFKRRDLGMFEAVFVDGSGARLAGKWFHGEYLRNVLTPGLRLAIYGKVEFDGYKRELTMLHPEFEVLRDDDEDGEAGLHTGRIVPIYEAAGKVSTRVFRTIVKRLIDDLPRWTTLCRRVSART